MLIKDILHKRKNSDKVAIKYINKSITYKQLYNSSNEIAKIIDDFSILSNNIGIFLPNSIDYIVSFFAIANLDKVIVPLGVLIKKDEIKSSVKYCDLNIVISDTRYSKQLKESLSGLPFSIFIFNIDDYSFQKVGNAKLLLNKQNVIINDNENDVALMIHSSGTMSIPKIVMLSHKNIISNAVSIIKSLNLTSEDITLITLPLHLVSANTSQFITHIYLGATIILMGNIFFPNIFFKLIEQERISNFTGVPATFLMILCKRNKIKYDISSLKLACFGGGKLSVDKISQLIETFKTIKFVHMYGQTEASARLAHLLFEDSIRKIGSVGKSIPCVDLRVVRENGEDADTNEIGEVIAAGPNIMKGYYKKEEETKKVLRNKWLYTGDLGFFDKEKYLYIVGRKKNIIISGGMNIYPEEIEECLMLNSYIEEVCIVGEQHELLGEIPVAKIKLKNNNKKITGDYIINDCLKKMANYKVPKKVYFINFIDKTCNGKIKRY